jgi:hypothetical protein
LQESLCFLLYLPAQSQNKVIKLNKIIIVLYTLVITSLLSGCLYPEQKLAKNRIPYEHQLQAVQSAVNQYKEKQSGLLPIKTKPFDTPIYQKYPLDFSKLVPLYLQDAPGNSFENGGSYQYVLVNVEEAPKVKLIDLVSVTTVQTVIMKLNAYRAKYGYPPYGQVIANNIFTIDYEKLGYDRDQYVVSPYTQNNLPIIINAQGELVIDYRMDLYHFLQKENEVDYKRGEDIRGLLVEHTPFVPVFSVPYTIDENNEPIFLIK